jgi:sec-independent protein translocase protein TatA
MNEPVQYMLAIGMPQGWEWLIILLIALLIWGKRLPDVARGLGKSLSEFKKGVKEAENAKDEVADEVKKVKDDVVSETKDVMKNSNC